MGNPLSDAWQFATLTIEDDLNHERGTGVLVGDTEVAIDAMGGALLTWENPKSRAYLATARHVLGTTESEIAATLHYTLCYSADGAQGLERRKHRFVLCDSPRNWALHPDKNVDVAVLDITTWLGELQQEEPRLRFCPLSEVANPTSLTAAQCDAGDDVFVLGYPLQLRQGRTNLPIVRKGVLASSPRRPLVDEDEQELRGFLVDGAIMAGSSGSPVISMSKHVALGDVAMLSPDRPMLIGIVTQEWFRKRENDTSVEPRGAALGYANLGFAHSAATVIETIAQLGHHDVRAFLQIDHDARWASELRIPEWGTELSGAEIDDERAYRVMLRLQRDRDRARGESIPFDEFADIPSVMGPVPSTR